MLEVEEILQMFYTAIIGSVLTFGMRLAGVGRFPVKTKTDLKNIKKVGRVVGKRQESIDTA